MLPFLIQLIDEKPIAICMQYNAKSHTASNSVNVGFAVLIAVVMRNTVFWVIMLCSPSEVS